MTEKTLFAKLEALKNAKLPLVFRTRRKIFVNDSRETCGYDPITGEGHSYRWYVLARRFGKCQVLNTYGYSMQTRKHVNKLSRLMHLLDIPYLVVEAPQGLQDMEAARDYCVRRYAGIIVANKYARKPINMGYEKKLISNLKKLGYKITQKDIDLAVILAEHDRRHRLDREKEKRQNKVKFVEGDEKTCNKVGMHVVAEYSEFLALISKSGRWSTRNAKEKYILEAKNKGFKKVYVYLKPADNVVPFPQKVS